MSWMDFLKTSPVEWLLEVKDTTIRYHTLVDIIGVDPADLEIQRLKLELKRNSFVKKVLNEQIEEGFWESSSNIYVPRYTATVWFLNILADFGLTLKNSPIKKAVNHVLKFQTEKGFFVADLNDPSWVSPGFNGLLLRSLIKFNASEDEIIKNAVWKGLNWLLKVQRYDGGWCDWSLKENKNYEAEFEEAHREEVLVKSSKMVETVNALSALIEIPEFAKRPSIKSGGEFILNHVLLEPEKMPHTEDYWAQTHIKELTYPQFFYDHLKVADILTRTGYNLSDERLKKITENILSMQNDDGSWTLQRSLYVENPPFAIDHNKKNLEFHIETVNLPSKWITLNILRILKKLSEK